jgi:LPXTG-site transpeptidase (sortase) family protein
VAGLCPYLGLDSNPNDVLLVASPHHRCYVRRTPERVGNEHQVAVCLTSSYRRCPRFLSVMTRHERQAAPSSRTQARPGPIRLGRQAVQPVRRKKAKGRSLTFTEVLVVTLVVGILLSFAFVGYAVFYRSRVGPGLAAATVVPEQVAVPIDQSPPAWTPTRAPSPTATAAEQVLPSATAEPVDPPSSPAVPTPLLPAATAAVRVPAQSPPTRLVLPAIGLDIPVKPVQVVKVGEGAGARMVWGALPNAGGFHHTSAYPGNPGNTVINGHRDIHAAVFRDLDQVEVGDPVRLYVDEVLYPYVATEILIVPETFASAEQRAENLRLIGYMPEERLTLITCTPVGLATHRLLVIARPANSGELVEP